jgi:hypothetical protein
VAPRSPSSAVVADRGVAKGSGGVGSGGEETCAAARVGSGGKETVALREPGGRVEWAREPAVVIQFWAGLTVINAAHTEFRLISFVYAAQL